ncbi:hypothetical protein JKP88DRAFT_317154 [Tribonema minus]|uniref:Uncharacterized protein n=1 Tax=Tribonema minus TaxID=303371 RepID=A0A835Z5X3_9STRA|nr:hypothetical protein JKP88DRAFT_317154 [Tribonema minus]
MEREERRSSKRRQHKQMRQPQESPQQAVSVTRDVTCLEALEVVHAAMSLPKEAWSLSKALHPPARRMVANITPLTPTPTARSIMQTWSVARLRLQAYTAQEAIEKLGCSRMNGTDHGGSDGALDGACGSSSSSRGGKGASGTEGGETRDENASCGGGSIDGSLAKLPDSLTAVSIDLADWKGGDALLRCVPLTTTTLSMEGVKCDVTVPAHIVSLTVTRSHLFRLHPLPATLSELRLPLGDLPRGLRVLDIASCGFSKRLPRLHEGLEELLIRRPEYTAVPETDFSLGPDISGRWNRHLPQLPQSLKVLHFRHSYAHALPPLPPALERLMLSLGSGRLHPLPEPLPATLRVLHICARDVPIAELPDALESLTLPEQYPFALPSPLPPALTLLEFRGSSSDDDGEDGGRVPPATAIRRLSVDFNADEANHSHRFETLPSRLEALRVNGNCVLPRPQTAPFGLPPTLRELCFGFGTVSGLPPLPPSLEVLSLNGLGRMPQLLPLLRKLRMSQGDHALPPLRFAIVDVADDYPHVLSPQDYRGAAKGGFLAFNRRRLF